MTDARAAALLALAAWQEMGTFIWDSLEKWKRSEKPASSDLNFAYELACGTMRQMRYLDAVSKPAIQKFPRKTKERMLLRLALYQRLFTPNIPLYAVVDTSVKLAKKYTNEHFAKFLNAVLRKELPIPALSLAEKRSYTDFFVTALIEQYGEETTDRLLDRQNHKPESSSFTIGDECYIQNITQRMLLEKQAARLETPPKKIADLCAAPGGKTLLLHKLFPNALLHANDIAAAKITALKENLSRFSNPAVVTNQPGESFSLAEPYDLVLVDAPCSNSGVLYKCPEARWRLEKAEIERLNDTQAALLGRAAAILAPEGKIWYQTCSILKQENEWLALEACKRFGLAFDGEPLLQLPDAIHEGGFSCVFEKIRI